MRSHTESHLPGRCKRCWVPERFCICEVVPSLKQKTKLVIVRHEREAYKSTGTARVAELALSGVQIVSFGDVAAEANALLEQTLSRMESPAVLFPAEDAAPVTKAVGCLVVLDGTWKQTRKMHKKLEVLKSVPAVSLLGTPEKVVRLRETTFASGRSTLEAIAEALLAIEGPDIAAELFQLHNRFVEHVLKARGIWQQKTGVKWKPDALDALKTE
jgi:DTW domain-containing protein